MSSKIKYLFILLALVLSCCIFASCELNFADLPSVVTPETEKEEEQEKDPEPEEPTPTGLLQVSFYCNDECVGSQGDIQPGSILNEPSFTIDSDLMYTYTFLGWDSNEDGEVESFPYTINEDTVFRAIYTKEYISYSYSIYVRGELKYSTDEAHYGDTINYPEVQSCIEPDGSVYLFDGWSYDGVYDALTYLQVSRNVRIDAHYANNQLCKIYYNGSIYAYVLEEGSDMVFLSGYEIEPKEHYAIAWYLNDSYTSRCTLEKMPQGNITLYGREEKIEWAGKETSSEEALQQAMNLMVLNKVPSAIFHLTFEFDSLQDLTARLVNNGVDAYPYSLRTIYDDGDLTLEFTYSSVNTTTSKAIYTQKDSLNILGRTVATISHGDSFVSDTQNNSMEVATSEALYYALEHGYTPVITNDSVRTLYGTMKEVLKSCCSDTMTDVEKALAIYEWIVMNVTYDGDVLELAKNKEENVSIYRSFYLEGVFLDHLAVCDGISKAYACLCQMEGIPCVRLTGETKDGDISHAWNKIQIDGTWYIVDATSAGTIIDKQEVLTYEYFLISDTDYTFATPADGQEYNYTASSTYEFYKTRSVTIQEKSYALEVTTKEAFADLLKAFIDLDSENISLNFYLNMTYDSFDTFLNDVLNEYRITGSIQYSAASSSILLFK